MAYFRLLSVFFYTFFLLEDKNIYKVYASFS